MHRFRRNYGDASFDGKLTIIVALNLAHKLENESIGSLRCLKERCMTNALQLMKLHLAPILSEPCSDFRAIHESILPAVDGHVR